MLWVGIAIGLGVAAIVFLGWVLAQSFRAEHDDAPEPVPSPGDDPEGFSDPRVAEVWISPEARKGLGWPPEPPQDMRGLPVRHWPGT